MKSKEDVIGCDGFKSKLNTWKQLIEQMYFHKNESLWLILYQDIKIILNA